MQFDSLLSDQATLTEVGARLAAARLALNKTQAALAAEAGVSKRTIERLEKGAAATEIGAFIRVLRVLGLLGGLNALVPPPLPSPLDQLRLARRQRQRARAPRVAHVAAAAAQPAPALIASEPAPTPYSTSDPASSSKKWTWGTS